MSKLKSGSETTSGRSNRAVVVGETPCGKGVFATRRFKKDEQVGRIYGKVYDEPGYGSEYCIDMGDDLTLEPHAPFRFLNHSCDPNCTLYVIEFKIRGVEKRRVVLETLKTIAKGEELTIDYAWSADAAIPCLCGSAKCRGWVVCEEDLAKVKRRKKG